MSKGLLKTCLEHTLLALPCSCPLVVVLEPGGSIAVLFLCPLRLSSNQFSSNLLFVVLLPSALLFVSLIPQQKGKGSIDREDLQAVCHQFQLHVSGSVLDDLMDYCDTNRDGLIDFVEFANFLSWKEMMPIGSQEEGFLTRGW